MNTKRCPHCGLIKPLSEFQRCRWMADGRQTWCRDCMNEKNRSYSHPQGKEHASLASVPTARLIDELCVRGLRLSVSPQPPAPPKEKENILPDNLRRLLEASSAGGSPTARALLELAEGVADVDREIRKLKAQ